MFSKKFFPNALPISLVLSSILVGSSFLTPTWAMEFDGIDYSGSSKTTPKIEYDLNFLEAAKQIVSKPTLKTDDFEYDLNFLEAARQIVSRALYLPELIRAQFETTVQHHDRKKCLEYFYLEVKAQNKFLINLNSVDKEALESYKGLEDKELIKEIKETLIKKIKEITLECIKKDYVPYTNNIKNIFDTKGEFNTDMFDAFFYHVLGVYPGFDGKTYPEKDIQNLLEQLREVKFLKNINLDQLLSLKETYKPLHQVEKFFKKYQKKPLILIIGHGHSGVPGFESISRYIYGEVLTIDIQPHILADITSDINDLSLLAGLKKYFPEHFDVIFDTTNMGPEIFQEETFNVLFSLLRPGGQFKETGMKFPYIRTKTKEVLTKEPYNFKPIYCEENKDLIIALEK
jgi:hypothetical protein